VTAVWTIAGYGLREALRRKVFLVVCLLTIAFLALYWIGTRYAFHHIDNVVPPEGIDPRTFAGAFLFGMAMFGTLFLGVVLAIFLTLGVVRGDAERALLQPLVVRPVGRSTLLVARFLGAAAVCAPYVLILYFAGMLVTGLEGSWWPDRIVMPGLELAGGVLIVAALSLLGSVFLSSIANGIAVFMIFGAGLVAGLLGNIGHVLNSHGLVIFFALREGSGQALRIAAVLALVVLAPVFVLGAAVLYVDQKARVESGPRPRRRRDADLHSALELDGTGRSDAEGKP
jgi:Cu-processing system permease protein